jgi:hypothetical protein
MKPELSERLLTRFPWARPDESDTKSPWTLFGFECGDGWFRLICDMLDEMEAAHKKNGLEVKVTVGQIKEKFGILRVYLDSDLDEVYKIVGKYQEKSKEVCYDCGKRGIPRKLSGWQTTMCKSCEERRMNQPKD